MVFMDWEVWEARRESMPAASELQTWGHPLSKICVEKGARAAGAKDGEPPGTLRDMQGYCAT